MVGVFVILMDGAQYLLGPICPATGVTASRAVWGGQLGDEGLHSLCCWLS